MTTDAPDKTKHFAARERRGERSFTLLETIVALGLMVVLILEVSSVQGNAIVFNSYIKRSSEAMWLARRVMAQVEYNFAIRPLKDLDTAVKDVRIEDFPDYSYDLEIKDWKFPLTQLMTGGLAGGEEEEESEGKDGGMGGMVKQLMEQVFGEELLKTAHVTVYWPSGAQRDSVSLTLLITNQRKIDDLIVTLKPAWDEAIRREEQGEQPPKPTPTPGARPGGGPGGNPP